MHRCQQASYHVVSSRLFTAVLCAHVCAGAAQPVLGILIDRFGFPAAFGVRAPPRVLRSATLPPNLGLETDGAPPRFSSFSGDCCNRGGVWWPGAACRWPLTAHFISWTASTWFLSCAGLRNRRFRQCLTAAGAADRGQPAAPGKRSQVRSAAFHRAGQPNPLHSPPSIPPPEQNDDCGGLRSCCRSSVWRSSVSGCSHVCLASSPPSSGLGASDGSPGDHQKSTSGGTTCRPFPPLQSIHCKTRHQP